MFMQLDAATSKWEAKAIQSSNQGSKNIIYKEIFTNTK